MNKLLEILWWVFTSLVAAGCIWSAYLLFTGRAT